MTALWLYIRIGGVLAALGLLAALLIGALDGYVGAAYVMFGTIATSALLAFAMVSVSTFRVSLLVIGLNGLVILASVIFVGSQLAFDGNVRSAATNMREELTKLEDIATALSLSGSEPQPISDTDLPATVMLLNQLRDLPFGYAETIGAAQAGSSGPPSLGLVDSSTLETASEAAYRRALSNQLLPRLILRQEDLMLANMNNPDFLYEVLKVYLMLGLQGPMDTRLVKESLLLDWPVAFPRPARNTLRQDLERHVDVMLSAPIDQIALNGPLIEAVRARVAEVPLAQRMYDDIVNSPRARQLPVFRLSDVGGPAIARVFVRSSGKPLTEGIDGIFTYAGFNDVFLEEILGVAQRMQQESWVLGPQSERIQGQAQLAALSRDVLDLYYSDYISAYDQMLSDIDIIPIENLSHAVEVTNVLSGPTSPLVNILNAVAAETRLTEDRSPFATEELLKDATRIGLQRDSAQRILRQLEILRESSASANASSSAQPGASVEERFQWLHQLTENVDGQPSQLDELRASLTEVYRELNRLFFAGGASGAATDLPALARFEALASRLPDPLPRWARQVSAGASSVAIFGTRSAINARWQAEVLPFCEAALTSRYPFDRGAQSDVALADFARLFAPGGLIDNFFDENLREYVDTRARPWAWTRDRGTALGIGQAVLQQMQYAAEIRDAFFASGGDTPSVKFQITPEALDPKAAQVKLTIDGQDVIFQHSATPSPAVITWPGRVGAAQVTFQSVSDNAVNSLGRNGPWAWFRLLSAAELRRTNVSDRTRVIFNVGGRIAIFQLLSNSIVNAFNLPALSNFRCPTSF